MNKNYLLLYHIIITCIFIYVYVNFLTMKSSNIIYKLYTNYILNKYCLILYVALLIIIWKYFDIYTAILLLLLIISPFNMSLKEYFENDNINNNKNNINTNLLLSQTLGIDDRFKMDEIVVKNILKQIKAQVDYDPYKAPLTKDVIYEIYNKYFDNDIFTKLKTNNDDSKSYIAAGNFNYIPTIAQVDYDIPTYQNLSTNIQLGVNPLNDGISNKTKIKRN